MMPRASSGIVPYLAGLPGVQALCTAHLFTLGCGPVLMWARPLVPCGVPIWSSVLQWEGLQDGGWGVFRAPQPRCLLRRPPSLGHSRAQLLSRLLLLWLMLLMRGQVLVQDVHPASRLPFLFWRHCCVSSPHFPLPPGHRDLADVALRCLAANSQEYPPRARRRWPSLWCWSTACTIFCGSLCPPIVDSSDW